MNLILFFLILISESLCMQYLPNDNTLNMPNNLDYGYFYLKNTDWPTDEEYLFLYLIVINGIIDTTIQFGVTNTYPSSDANIPAIMKRGPYYKKEVKGQATNYIFMLDSFKYTNNKYYVIKYSGFLGNYLFIACTTRSDNKAIYLPKGKMFLPFSSKYFKLYLTYSNFNDNENFVLYFEIENGSMESKIQYKETNVDPNLVTLFTLPKTKESENVNYAHRPNTTYEYIFPKEDKKYLIISLVLRTVSNITITSSIASKYLKIKDTLNLSPNYTFGLIYLNYSDYRSVDNIYIYFQLSGEMNDRVGYFISSSSKIIYEEIMDSLNFIKYDEFEKNNGQTFYGYEFDSRYFYSGFLLIKYSGFRGKSINVTCSTKIRYLPKDKNITLNNIKYGYIYLNYNDYINSDDKKNIYLYFEIFGGKMNDNIYYENTNIYPIYEGQFKLMNSKNGQIKGNSQSNNKRNMYILEKLDYNYIVIGYENFTGYTLNISSLSINPIPLYLSMNYTLNLPSYSKSGFIYLKYSDFSKQKDIEDFYLYFRILKGTMHSNISYLNVNEDPTDGRFYSSKFNYQEMYFNNSESNIYVYKIHIFLYSYIIIKYSVFNGNSITVSSSFDDPLAKSSNSLNTKTLLIIFSIIGSIIIIAIIVVLIYVCFCKKRKRESKIENIIQPNNSTDSNEILYPSWLA